MRSKSIFWIIAFFIAVALLVFVTAAKAQTDAPEDTDQKPRTLSINGSGLISITPDVATINIGVQTESENAQQAVASNNQQSQDLLDALIAAGVADKDIHTSSFSIHPRQEYDERGQPTGAVTYVVNNTVTVKVRNLDTIGSILDAAVQAGANNINGIQFDIEDRDAAQQQAITAAMDNAQERAEVLAESAGVELVEIMSLQTYIGGGSPAPYSKGFEMVVQEAAISVPVSPGEMQIMVDVSVVYAIR
jgi:uncharacterized protein YggE